MDRPRLIRRLRIAASVFFALIAVAFCVQWVRSYWVAESVFVQTTYLEFGTGAAVGTCFAAFGQYETESWSISYNALQDMALTQQELDTHTTLGFAIFNSWGYRTVVMPIAVPILISAFVAWRAWVRRQLPAQFSLRTLLIATTLLAVVLGLVRWYMR